jgi:hypothetical protein
VTSSQVEPDAPHSEEPGEPAAVAAAEPAPEGELVATDTLSAVQALLAAPVADEPVVDEDATIRLNRPPVFAEEDLRLDLESLEISQEPSPEPDATLDEYFDQLDAAFAHLTAGPADRDAAPVPEAPVVEPAEVPAPGPEVGAASARDGDVEVAPTAIAVDVPDAFAALLDAEREHDPDAARLGLPGLAAGIVLPGTAVTQAFIDEVVRRVSERLAEAALRVQVTEIVSAVAERLVREEIERLKSGIRF